MSLLTITKLTGSVGAEVAGLDPAVLGADDALNLLHMIYSLIMVAMAVEIMHQPAPVDAADAVMIRTGGPVP